jgi:hypothetical protein
MDGHVWIAPSLLMKQKIKRINLLTHTAFVGHEKAFDKVFRNKLCPVMTNRSFPQLSIKV